MNKKIKILILCILCVLVVAITFCTTHSTVEPPPMPTQEPEYYIEYTKGIFILREVDNG